MIAFNDYICRHLLLSSLNNVSYLHMKRLGIFQLLALEPEIRTTDYALFSMPQCFHLEFATHKDLMTCFFDFWQYPSAIMYYNFARLFQIEI